MFSNDVKWYHLLKKTSLIQTLIEAEFDHMTKNILRKQPYLFCFYESYFETQCKGKMTSSGLFQENSLCNILARAGSCKFSSLDQHLTLDQKVVGSGQAYSTFFTTHSHETYSSCNARIMGIAVNKEFNF